MGQYINLTNALNAVRDIPTAFHAIKKIPIVKTIPITWTLANEALPPNGEMYFAGTSISVTESITECIRPSVSDTSSMEIGVVRWHKGRKHKGLSLDTFTEAAKDEKRC